VVTPPPPSDTTVTPAPTKPGRGRKNR